VLVSSPKEQVIGQEKMSSSCARGGLDLILGKISSPKEWLSIATSYPGKWDEAPSLKVFRIYTDVVLRDIGLSDLRGLFQPN